MVGHRVKCQKKKQKKLNVERALVTGYYLIKDPQSLGMKYYLVTGGLSSVYKPCSICCCFFQNTIHIVSIPLQDDLVELE